MPKIKKIDRIRDEIEQLITNAQVSTPGLAYLITVESGARYNIPVNSFRNRELTMWLPAGHYTSQQLIESANDTKNFRITMKDYNNRPHAFSETELRRAGIQISTNEEIGFVCCDWRIRASKSTLTIGCQTHSYEQWLGNTGKTIIAKHRIYHRRGREFQQLLEIAIPLLHDRMAALASVPDVKAVRKEYRDVYPDRNTKRKPV